MSAVELDVHDRPTMSTRGTDCHGPHSTTLSFSTGTGRLRSFPVDRENAQGSSSPAMSSTRSDEMDRVRQGHVDQI